MGFSVMLANEYVLIVPFAYQLHSRLEEPAGRQAGININCINFTQHQFGLNDDRISAQQKALTVGGNFI